MTFQLRAACTILVMALLMGQAGCRSIESSRAAAGRTATPAAVCDRLYCGQAIPGDGNVTEVQWAAFVAAEVAPRFPEGFTTYRAGDHWRGDDGVAVTEQTMVLEIVHAATPTLDAAVNEIARAYRERFRQEAVMRVRTPVEQTFIRH